MMQRTPRAWAAACVLLTGTASASAQAPQDPAPGPPATEGDAPLREAGGPPPEARIHFEAGRAYYDRGLFEEAGREFQRAYGLDPRPALLYNLFLAYRDAGQKRQAVDYLRRYLAESKEAPNRAMLERRLSILEAELAQESSSGDSEPAPPPIHEPLAPPASDTLASRKSSFAPWSWVALGVGGALLAGGVVTGALALDAKQTLNDDLCDASARCEDGFEDEVDRGRTLVTLTNVFLVAGGATAITGAVLLALDLLDSNGTERTPPAAVACTTEGCLLSTQANF